MSGKLPMVLTKEGLSRVIQVNEMFEHMLGISVIMFDKSRWYTPIYQALAADKFALLCRHHPELEGKENEVGMPILFAMGYAQSVALGSAAELTLLHLYVNSLEFYLQFLPAAGAKLPALSSWLETRRQKLSMDEFAALSDADRLIKLKEISFSDLPTASRYFSDIYGPDCFENAWTPKVYRELKELTQTLQARRNNFAHRGGESKKGSMENITEPELMKEIEDGKKISGQFIVLSFSLRKWWHRQLAQRCCAYYNA